jgi:F-type H+-transporting ATPase subunit delta
MQAGSRGSLAEARERLDAITGALDTGALEALTEQLFAFAHLIQGELRVRRALTDTSAEAAQKIALLDRLVGSQLGADARGIVDLLVAARWSTARDLVEAADTLAALTLLAVAERGNVLDEVEDELFRFARVLDGQPTLRAALIDPTLPTDRKISVLDALIGGGKAQLATVRLVSEAVLFARGRTLDEALETYAALAAVRRDRLSAHVRTAVALTEAQESRLAATLERQYGRTVDLHIEIDPAVVGGLNIQIGDEVVDATITRRLGDARQRFAS